MSHTPTSSPKPSPGTAAKTSLSARLASGSLSTTVLPPAARLCSNCNTTMEGPFCYQCGQHERHPVRSFGLFVRDILHDVLNLDSRALRTLKPLFFHPGWLTLEYLHGKRERFVPPLRLYVIASLLFFLMLSSSNINIGDDQKGDVHVLTLNVSALSRDLKKAPESLRKNETKEQVALLEKFSEPPIKDSLSSMEKKAIEQAVTDLAAARVTMADPDFLAKQELKDKAAAEIREKEIEDDARNKVEENFNHIEDSADFVKTLEEEIKKTKAKEAEREKNSDKPFKFTVVSDRPVPFLGDTLNKKIKQLNEQLQIKLELVLREPRRGVALVINELPQSMFFLLPMFALCLTVFYPLSKRMYLEHLIVAVHSHCFMFLLLAVTVPLAVWGDSVGERWPWIESVTSTVMVAGGFWLPVYLFLMQKRLYGQGWLFTLLKFMLIGSLYLALLAVALAISGIVGLLNA